MNVDEIILMYLLDWIPFIVIVAFGLLFCYVKEKYGEHVSEIVDEYKIWIGMFILLVLLWLYFLWELVCNLKRKKAQHHEYCS